MKRACLILVAALVLGSGALAVYWPNATLPAWYTQHAPTVRTTAKRRR